MRGDFKPEFTELWEQGILAAWYLREDQIPIYQLLLKSKNPFIECSRQYGKTTTVLCFVLEKLRQNPGWITRWCEPWKNQCREIVQPAMEEIMSLFPKHLRFKYRSMDSVYESPWGSRLYLRGVNEDKGDSARGPHAHIVVADEFGTWKEPDYIVNEALNPQLITTDGHFIFTSTPPRDLGHPYYQYKARALSQDRYVQRVIYQNASLTPERIEDLKEKAGGENSPAWKREYLCQECPDSRMQIIPEYKEELVALPNDYERPKHLSAYVVGDHGVDDNTFILFGYYDFLKDWIVIEDELVVNGATISEIVSGSRKKEEALYLPHQIQARVCDADKQVLLEMVGQYRYSVTLPRKEDKFAAIHDLRVRMSQGKFKISEKCKLLRYQLKVGIWSSEKHTDFQRSSDEKLKHLDGIAAAIYFNRSVNTRINPYPQYEGLSPYTHHLPVPSSQDKDSQTLKEALSLLDERFDFDA